MTWPMVFGVLSLMSFQLADSFFVARLGVEPLAVVGFTIPIYQLVIGLQVGIGIATTALISQRLGQGNDSEARALGGSILILGSISVLLLCSAIWVFREHILYSMGGEANLLPLINEFWSVFLCSAICGAILYFGYSICRAHGDTKLPGILMVVTSLLNIALDPLFIFYFDLGLVGAAYATLTSFALGVIVVFPKIVERKWASFILRLERLGQHLMPISSIAAPAMVSQIMPAISSMLATLIVASYGTAAVAAWGVGIRLEFFCIVTILALTMSLPPMVGRFYGAGDFVSIRHLISIAGKFVLFWQLALAILLALLANPLSLFLSNDPNVAPILADFIIVIPLSYSALGICMLSVSLCNAIGAPRRALLISFVRLFVCFVPCLLLGSLIAELHGIMFGALTGNILAGISAWYLLQQRLEQVS